jgi:hypothetical protein
MGPVDELARSLRVALRPDFAEREPTARQLAELLLDAVAAALPLTRHEPAEAPLRELEALASQADVYAWEGAPGWDVVLERGLGDRGALEAGPSVLDGLGAKSERTQQRGELKRRAHAQATLLVQLAREAARFDAGAQSAGARVLDQEPTLPAAAALLAAHAALLRLVGLGAASSLLLTAEDANAGALPPSAEEQLLREIDGRGEGFLSAQEEWIARLLAKNPAAAAAPAFRTFYAGLSQSLRAAPALRRFRDDARSGRLAGDPEALLAAIASWQPFRWPSLRSGAPSAWLVELCTPAPGQEPPLRRLERECSAGLDLFSRLWFAENLTPAAFTALAALLMARCASIVALWEESGGGKPVS